jgi:hypothetical protein
MVGRGRGDRVLQDVCGDLARSRPGKLASYCNRLRFFAGAPSGATAHTVFLIRPSLRRTILAALHKADAEFSMLNFPQFGSQRVERRLPRGGESLLEDFTMLGLGRPLMPGGTTLKLIRSSSRLCACSVPAIQPSVGSTRGILSILAAFDAGPGAWPQLSASLTRFWLLAC